MEWYELMKNAGKRPGKSSGGNDESRSVFQRDYDRIIFFDAFRRLQNKTQVLPVPKSEEVRNRLTHSLETASVGRSLGYLAGKYLIETYTELKKDLHLHPSDFGYMVSAAALTHDIGNPPFGHEGEKAVSDFFENGKGKEYINNLSPKEKADFLHFDGNAAGFRIIAGHVFDLHGHRGNLRLTFGTYGSFVKYPKESLPDRSNENKKSLKKSGLFQSEVEIFEQIARELNIDTRHQKEGKAWLRYPLVFLTEAADDICYTIIDYEDGFYLGFIPQKNIHEKLLEIARLDDSRYKYFKQLKDP
jgi:dGTPase